MNSFNEQLCNLDGIRAGVVTGSNTMHLETLPVINTDTVHSNHHTTTLGAAISSPEMSDSKASGTVVCEGGKVCL